MVGTFHGIDFSGNDKMWTRGCRRSNVWIATAELRADSLEVVALRPVQCLPGTSDPFDRLVSLLARDDYIAAAIDAPFSLPCRHMPADGLPGLLRDVAQFETERRPFAKGEELVKYATANASLERPKPLRKTEQVWRERGVNIRSTLWSGPRGGAPFTAASLTLLAKTGRPIWPWTRCGPGMLVESFPAGQLHQWNLPHKGYDGSDGFGIRACILDAITPCIRIPCPLHRHCRENADALDSVLCLFAAIAATDNSAPIEEPSAAEHEGWIAVHPGRGSGHRTPPETVETTMSDTQTPEQIDLVYKSKHAPVATRNGNNAAWMCWCGSRQPLLGGGHGGKHNPVDCPSCGSRYKVCFGNGGDGKNRPIKVVQIK